MIAIANDAAGDNSGNFWAVTYAMAALHDAGNGLIPPGDIRHTVRRGQSAAFLLGEQWRTRGGDDAARWYGQLPAAMERAHEHVLRGGDSAGVSSIIAAFAVDAGRCVDAVAVA